MQAQKKYPLNQSPLYGLSNRRTLYELLVTNNNLLKSPHNNKKLGCILSEINYLHKFESFLKEKNYRVFEEKSGRLIQDPKPFLKLVHKKLANLLSRIETPHYLHSGVKRKSYVTNATHHLKTSSYVLTLDLSKFYQSSSKEFIFKAFKYNFNMSDDVAWLVTDIVNYNGFLPTGSPVSQLIAFFTYQRTFDKINGMAEKRHITFSLYVDDMAFSSNKAIPNNMEDLVAKEFENIGLKIKHEKTRKYTKKQIKTITGCDIHPNSELKVPEKRRIEIIQTFEKINKLSEQERKSLLGKVQAARQIEPNIFETELHYLISKK